MIQSFRLCMVPVARLVLYATVMRDDRELQADVEPELDGFKEPLAVQSKDLRRLSRRQ